jgi:hypothetical protein
MTVYVIADIVAESGCFVRTLEPVAGELGG